MPSAESQTLLDRQIEQAVELLRRGQPVGLPTETVYGLAADATSSEAVARVFALKGRPSDHPLIVHVGAADWVGRYADAREPRLAARCQLLTETFWPGPLTLVVPKGAAIRSEVTAGLPTMAIRCPAHPVALQVLLALNRPLAAPSANRFGRVSPTTRAHVVSEFGAELALVLDGGPCSIGVESTIVDVISDQPRVLRFGAVTREQLANALGEAVALPRGAEAAAGDDLGGSRDTRLDAAEPKVPGTLPSHYAPRAVVELVARGELWTRVGQATEGESTLLGVIAPTAAPGPLPKGVVVRVIGKSPQEQAHELYAALRELDDLGCGRIVAGVTEEDGLARAVADRLQRAAAPRP